MFWISLIVLNSYDKVSLSNEGTTLNEGNLTVNKIGERRYLPNLLNSRFPNNDHIF